MSMINSVDNMPDEPVIAAVAEMLALMEIDSRKFDSTSVMGGFQFGYQNGFAAGAQFMRTFLRKREKEAIARSLEKTFDKENAAHNPPEDNQIKPIFECRTRIEKKDNDIH